MFFPPRCTSGFDENLDVQGELFLQDTFQVWDPKSLIRKGRDRHLFLFEISLVFSKEIKDSAGRTKYIYKNRLLVRGSTVSVPVQCNAKGPACLGTYSPYAEKCCYNLPPITGLLEQ